MSAIVRVPPTWILVGITLTGPFAMNLLVPSMPGIARDFGAGFGTVQWTLTAYLIGIASGQLLYGPLSDRYGRRPVLLFGMSVYFVASLAAAFAPTIGWLIALRLAQALGGCAGLVLTRATVRDVHHRDRAASVLGYITMAMAVGPAIAPAVGGHLELWYGWRASFWLVAGVGAVMLAAALWRLHETNRTPSDTLNAVGMIRTYARLAGSRAYADYVMSSAMASGAFFAFVGGAPFVVVEVIGATPRDYGVYFILVSLGFMAGSFTAGRVSARVGIDGMIRLGIAVSAAGICLLLAAAAWLPPSLPALFLPMAVVGYGNGCSMPNGIAGAVSVNPGAAGAASGLLGFTQMAAGGALTLLVGGLLETTQWPLVLVMAASTAASAGGILLVASARRRAAQPKP